MKKTYKELLIVGVFLLLTIFTFRDYFFKGLVPFPSNLLLQFFQPWALYQWPGYGSGLPAKPIGFDNLQIYYPTRLIVTDQIKNLALPLWNPYSFSGNVLHATSQAAIFHPFSWLFLVLPQIDAWSIIVILQPFLAGVFMYFFLRQLSLNKKSSFFGALTFAFCGMMVIWWEEMFMAVYSMLFLPLICLSIVKIFKKRSSLAFLLLVVGLSFSIFSGWFQATFYVWVFSFIFALAYYLTHRTLVKEFAFVIFAYLLSVVICAVQLLPALEAYQWSLRASIDTFNEFHTYLISWKYLVTLIAPDYFGNPATHNQFGFGFYHERVIFIGLAPLLFVLYELFHFRKNNFYQKFFKTSTIIVFSLGFSQPVSWFLLYQLHLPFISQMTPSRIFFLSAFGFSVIASYGIERYLRSKKILVSLLVIAILTGVFVVAWSQAIINPPEELIHKFVSRRNLILPSAFFVALVGLFLVNFLKKTNTLYIYLGIIVISLLSIFYFTNKYLYFYEKKYVFPQVGVISKLQKIGDIDRFWSVGEAYIDSNLLSYYRLFSPEGYDSFNIGRYNELLYTTHTNGLISDHLPRANSLIYKAKTVDEINVNPYRKRVLSLLGVKYIVAKHQVESLVKDRSYKKIWTDGVFDIYQNIDAYPRVFLVGDYIVASGKQQVINEMYKRDTNLRNTVVLEEDPGIVKHKELINGKVRVKTYKPDYISIETDTPSESMLFLSDSYYPGWTAYVDRVEKKIYRADYTFRSVVVPQGKHKIEFRFKPVVFLHGLYASVFGLVVLAGTVFYLRKR